MKISTTKLRKYMHRFGVTPADMGDMLCLYVATFEAMMRDEYLELDMAQAERMLQWFGWIDTISLMHRGQFMEAKKEWLRVLSRCV